jgi:hypothetical protein
MAPEAMRVSAECLFGQPGRGLLREPLKSAELEESVAGIFLQGHEISAFSYVRQVV